MTDEPFLLIHLKEEKTKKLANALTNKSASKVLTYLADHEGSSETQIAQALKIPTSTVHYTMKTLLEAKLVLADEYTYSAKGREVYQYKLAKKYIIIAPDGEEENFLEKIKKYLPAVSLTAGGGLVFAWLQGFIGTTAIDTAAEFEMMAKSTLVSDDMMVEGAQRSMDTASAALPTQLSEPSQSMFSFIQQSEWIVPFLLGVTLTLLLLLLLDAGKRYVTR